MRFDLESLWCQRAGSALHRQLSKGVLELSGTSEVGSTAHSEINQFLPLSKVVEVKATIRHGDCMTADNAHQPQATLKLRGKNRTVSRL